MEIRDWRWRGLGLALVAMVFWCLYHDGPNASWLPGCLFRRWTAWLCPACGMTRATYALMHGQWETAWRLNPAGVLGWLALMMLLGCAACGLRPWRCGRQTGPFGAGLLVLGIIAYWVLRNLPSWPYPDGH